MDKSILNKWNMIEIDGAQAICTGCQDPSDSKMPYRFPEPTFVRDFTDTKFPLDEIRNRPMAPNCVAAYQKNYKIHKPLIEKGIVELDGLWKDKTVIICGNGPSLSQTGSMLKEHPNLKIIATNGSMQSLSNDIVDLYMTLDWLGKDWWLKGFHNENNIPAVMSIFCNPMNRKYFKDIYYFTVPKMKGFWDESIECYPLGMIQSGRSVTYSAFHLAWKMGCKNFVFVGCDGCYTNGVHHHNDSIDEKRDNNMYIKRDIFNRVVVTESMYEGICNNLSGAAYFVKQRNKDYRIINATGCGIMKTHMEIMSIEKVYEEILGGEK